MTGGWSLWAHSENSLIRQQMFTSGGGASVAWDRYMAYHAIHEGQAYLRQKKIIGEFVVEMVIWQLPQPTSDRPHGIKYRLYCGQAGKCLVRYDNETGKGDHVHDGDDERPYLFVSLDQLISDFEADVLRLIGG